MSQSPLLSDSGIFPWAQMSDNRIENALRTLDGVPILLDGKPTGECRDTIAIGNSPVREISAELSSPASTSSGYGSVHQVK